MKFTREEMFSWAMEGRIVCVEQLPNDKKTSSVATIDIKAENGMSPDKLLNTLIVALGDKPKYGSGELRSRQFISLIKTNAANGGQLVFLINDAHKLPPRTLHIFKPLGEMFHYNEPVKLGFIFLGDMIVLKKKFVKIKDIEVRADILLP